MSTNQAKVFDLRKHANYKPDVAGLARNQLANARAAKEMTTVEFAETLGDLVGWPVTAEAVEAWETTAVPPGDVLVAAGMVSHQAPTGTGRAPASDLVGQVIGDRYSDVTAVYSSRSEFATKMPVHDLMANASEVRAVGLSLNMLCQQYSAQQLKQNIEAGMSMQLLFLDPAGNSIKSREKEEGYPAGHLSALTSLNIQTIERLQGQLSPEASDRLAVKVYDEVIRFNVLLIDTRLCIMQSYLPETRGVDSPTFVVERRWASGGLYSTFDLTFTSLWNRS